MGGMDMELDAATQQALAELHAEGDDYHAHVALRGASGDPIKDERAQQLLQDFIIWAQTGPHLEGGAHSAAIRDWGYGFLMPEDCKPPDPAQSYEPCIRELKKLQQIDVVKLINARGVSHHPTDNCVPKFKEKLEAMIKEYEVSELQGAQGGGKIRKKHGSKKPRPKKGSRKRKSKKKLSKKKRRRTRRTRRRR